MPDEAGCLSGNDPFAVQGGYDLCIAVKPDDPNTVFIGGTNVYRSTDGFSSTANTTRIGGYVSASSYGLYLNHHPDIHFLTFAQGGGGTLMKMTCFLRVLMGEFIEEILQLEQLPGPVLIMTT